MSNQDSSRARAFGSVAAAYDRARPDYPAQAAAWLMGGEARTVVELGAGTGKLTAELVRRGHDVHATDPDPEMLRVLQERCPGVRTSIATAEAIPAGDRSVDVVVAAHAFHAFDTRHALPEIARVLKPGGHVALVWNERDERIPWVRRLGRILGGSGEADAAAAVIHSDLFGFVEEEQFGFWQTIDRVSVLDLARTQPGIAALSEDERQAKLDEVSAFYAEYGRGMDGMQLPYRARCFRAKVSDRRPARGATRPTGPADGPDGPGGPSGRGEPAEPAGSGDGDDPQPGRRPTPPPADGETGEMLLIDFR